MPGMIDAACCQRLVDKSNIGKVILSPLLDNLLAYWPLNESGASLRSDMSANLVHLFEVSDKASRAAGVKSYSLDCKRDDAVYVGRGHVWELNLLTQDFTFAGWIKARSLIYSATVFSKAGGAGTFQSYRLRMRASTAYNLQWSIQTDTWGNAQPISTVVMDTANWHFFYCGYDAANHWAFLSVDNEALVTVGSAAGPAEDNGKFSIGTMNTRDITSAWDGYVCELGLWGEVLNPTKLGLLYQAGAGNTYPFDGTIPMVAGEFMYSGEA